MYDVIINSSVYEAVRPGAGERPRRQDGLHGRRRARVLGGELLPAGGGIGDFGARNNPFSIT